MPGSISKPAGYTYQSRTVSAVRTPEFKHELAGFLFLRFQVAAI